MARIYRCHHMLSRHRNCPRFAYLPDIMCAGHETCAPTVFDGSPVKNLSSGGDSAALIHRMKPQCLLSRCKRPAILGVGQSSGLSLYHGNLAGLVMSAGISQAFHRVLLTSGYPSEPVFFLSPVYLCLTCRHRL